MASLDTFWLENPEDFDKLVINTPALLNHFFHVPSLLPPPAVGIGLKLYRVWFAPSLLVQVNSRGDSYTVCSLLRHLNVVVERDSPLKNSIQYVEYLSTVCCVHTFLGV